MDKKVIEFIRKKDFRFVKNIGQGGTVKTVLLKDEIIDESFVCKKYSPYYEKHKDVFFSNFVEEIKILHKIYHKNIVRVFNYYLYPDLKTGYILMEYVKGQDLKEFISKNPHLLNDIFAQTLRGFNYLEKNNILHRDIRPENILVSEEGIVKIIDFGFGKRIKFEDDFDKSITLNWRFSPPNDFKNKIYDFRTEIYFVGKLFEEIIRENLIENFTFTNILNDMIKTDIDKRINSFTLINRRVISDENIGIEFSEDNKEIYKRFASGLTSIFNKIEQGAEYVTDIDKIISGLESVYRNSILEDYIQNPNSISQCFVNGGYYFKSPEFELNILRDFIKFINSVSIDKKRIILNNLWQRLDSIKRYREESDDLPF